MEQRDLIDIRQHRRHSLEVRRWLARVGEWALAHGRPLNVDAFTVIVLAKAEQAGQPLELWTQEGVFEFVWAHAQNWCALHGLETPGAVAETLWTLLAYLDAADGFAAGSDPWVQLKSPLLAYGGLRRDGRSRHPSQGRRSA
jgi:hypothetical protein